MLLSLMTHSWIQQSLLSAAAPGFNKTHTHTRLWLWIMMVDDGIECWDVMDSWRSSSHLWALVFLSYSPHRVVLEGGFPSSVSSLWFIAEPTPSQTQEQHSLHQDFYHSTRLLSFRSCFLVWLFVMIPNLVYNLQNVSAKHIYV